LDSLAMACMTPLKISLGLQRAPEEDNKGAPSRVFKHDAPNRDTTSRTPPSCQSNSESRLSPKDTNQLKASEGDVDTPWRCLQGGERHPRAPSSSASWAGLSSISSHLFLTPGTGAVPFMKLHTAIPAASCRCSHEAAVLRHPAWPRDVNHSSSNLARKATTEHLRQHQDGHHPLRATSTRHGSQPIVLGRPHGSPDQIRPAQTPTLAAA
jgi:hypothetical protein